MIQKYVPAKRLLHSKQYALMCDVSFMRTDFEPFTFIQPNQMEDIRSGHTIYCFSSRLNELFSYLYANTQAIQDVTVISGDNDHSCNPNGTLVGWPQYANHGIMPSPPNIKRWFAQNAEVDNSLMTPFSIGISKYGVNETNTKAYEITPASYRHMMLDYQRNKLVYSSCSISNNKHQRQWIVNTIKTNCPSATIVEYEPQPSYFRSLQEHLFVVCPPGNGKDTHRIWESLYFGSIPIVEDSSMNRHFAKLFPILVVENWGKVTPQFLLERYQEIEKQNWRYDLLDAENYFNYYGIPIKAEQCHQYQVVS